MTHLQGQIERLDRATAYEAAQLLAAEIGADPDVKPVDHPLLSAPLAHQPELEELAKVLLLVVAADDQQSVSDAIAGAGHKQIVLGGGELIALAYVLVEGLRLIVARNKVREHVEIVVEHDKDGQEIVTTTKRTTQYGVSGPVASLLRQIISNGEQNPPGTS